MLGLWMVRHPKNRVAIHRMRPHGISPKVQVEGSGVVMPPDLGDRGAVHFVGLL